MNFNTLFNKINGKLYLINVQLHNQYSEINNWEYIKHYYLMTLAQLKFCQILNSQ